MEEFVRGNIDLESNIGSRAKISYSKPLFPIFGSIKFLEKIKIKPFFLSWAMKNSKGNREIRVPGWLVSIPPIYDRGCISKYIIQQRGQCWSPQNEETLLILQIVSIYHHIRSRQITLSAVPNSRKYPFLVEIEPSFSILSRSVYSRVRKFSFIIYFIARFVVHSILATDGNNLKRANNPLVSCFVSFPRDNSHGWKDRYRY